MPSIPRKAIVEWRNHVEASFSEITAQVELARHGAHTTRTAASTADYTLLRVCLTPD